LLFMMLLVFALAGATTYQFFRGRKQNLILMREYVRELERALKPVDKNYVLLGLYSGFRAEFLLNLPEVYKAEASIALMPRESLLYYPISLLTLKHDRFYLVLRLNKKVRDELHAVDPKALKYNAPELEKKLKHRISVNGKSYLVNDPRAGEAFSELLMPEVLHVSLVPETNVLYLFAKPRPGLVERIASKALKTVKAL